MVKGVSGPPKYPNIIAHRSFRVRQSISLGTLVWLRVVLGSMITCLPDHAEGAHQADEAKKAQKHELLCRFLGGKTGRTLLGF